MTWRDLIGWKYLITFYEFETFKVTTKTDGVEYKGIFDFGKNSIRV